MMVRFQHITLFFILGFILTIFSSTTIAQPNKKRHSKQTIAYAVKINTDIPKDIAKKIKKVSLLYQLISKKPPSILALHKRVLKDIKKLKNFLKSLGYIDASIKYNIEEKNTNYEVELLFSLGTLYHFGEIQIVTENPEFKVPQEIIKFKKGKVFSSTKVTTTEDKIVQYAKNNGYPYAYFEDRNLNPNKKTNEVDIVFKICLGPFLHFGPVEIRGNLKTKKDFILKRILWKKGEIFSAEKIDETRRNLIKTEIFDGITIKPLDIKEIEEISSDEIPITIQLVEMKRHYIGGGLNYATEEGVGGKIFWGHRNLFNGGESLKIEFDRQGFKRGLNSQFKLPDIGLVNQSLIQTIDVSRHDTDAYQSIERNAFVGFDYNFEKYFSRKNKIQVSLDKVDGEKFKILSFPQEFSIDTTENLLDPVKGKRFTIDFDPNHIMKKNYFPFLRFQLEGSGYWSFNKKNNTVLAFRTKIGTIMGSHFNLIPKHKRFYIGGASSVRGYGFQKIGELTPNQDPKGRKPIGGRAFIEGGIETRFRVTESIGIVPFLDFGALTKHRLIDFNRLLQKKNEGSRVFFGVGLGGRYYFGEMGPVRVDIAVPLNRRPKIDRWYQIYLSFGQSF